MRTRIEDAASLLGPLRRIYHTSHCRNTYGKPSVGFGFYKVRIVQPGSADPADIQPQEARANARTAPDCRDMPDSPDHKRVAEASLRPRLRLGGPGEPMNVKGLFGLPRACFY
jgi:hypothetical protein